MVPGKHNMDIGTWDSPKNGPALVPPPIPMPVAVAPPPPPTDEPSPLSNLHPLNQPHKQPPAGQHYSHRDRYDSGYGDRNAGGGGDRFGPGSGDYRSAAGLLPRNNEYRERADMFPCGPSQASQPAHVNAAAASSAARSATVPAAATAPASAAPSASASAAPPANAWASSGGGSNPHGLPLPSMPRGIGPSSSSSSARDHDGGRSAGSMSRTPPAQREFRDREPQREQHGDSRAPQQRSGGPMMQYRDQQIGQQQQSSSSSYSNAGSYNNDSRHDARNNHYPQHHQSSSASSSSYDRGDRGDASLSRGPYQALQRAPPQRDASPPQSRAQAQHYQSSSSKPMAPSSSSGLAPRTITPVLDTPLEHPALEELVVKNQYNPQDFDFDTCVGARFFVIKSYSEDDIHRSIKYEIWCSTDHGNRRLDEAYHEREKVAGGVVYLLFSVNGSGHFCGMAQMLTPVDYNSVSSVWSQSKWKGTFKVKWIYVKDVPNTQVRHIRLENNENKSVTHSRDTQEVPNMQGILVVQIISAYKHVTSIFDDFVHYEKRQEEEDTKKVVVVGGGGSGGGGSDYEGHKYGGGSYDRGGGGYGGGYDRNNKGGYGGKCENVGSGDLG